MFSFLCFLYISAFTQEESNYDENTVFIISSIDYIIDGITRRFMIANRGELREGEEIRGYENLLDYVSEKTQILSNQRVLQSVNIIYSIKEKDNNGKYPVYLTVHTVDSRNIIALPKPSYSSNTGLSFSINYRDNNFLGTMQPLRIDLGYKYDEHRRNIFSAMLDSSTPFRAFDLNWNFKFYNLFEYRPNHEMRFYYTNTTGISVQLPFRSTAFILGFDETLILNDWTYNETLTNWFYLYSHPYITWIIPTGKEMGNYGHLVYVPTISAKFFHNLPRWPLVNNSPIIYFNHYLNFGRIDWIGNFRKGIYGFLHNAYSYDFNHKKNEIRPIDINFNFTGIGHFIIKEDFLGVSSRVMYRHWLFSGVHGEAGDVLRGIRNLDLQANFMLSVNLDINAKVLKVLPSEWFGISRLRVFNFDFHLIPFIDGAIYHHPVQQTALGFKNFILSAGMEAVIYPHFFRSFNLRVSLGINLTKYDASPHGIPGGYIPGAAARWELFIGTDLFF